MTASWRPGWPPGQQLGAALLGGSGPAPFATKTANYDVTTADGYIEADATDGSFTLTLPDATSCAGAAFTFIRTDGMTAINLVTVTGISGQLVGGMPSQLLVFSGHWISVLSDGTKWLMIGNNYAGTELGLSQLTSPLSTTNVLASDSVLDASKLWGMSITTMGVGRPVEVEYWGTVINTVANLACCATLLINGSQAGGTTAAVSSPEPTQTVTDPARFRTICFKSRPLLTAGTPYTFEVGIWCETGGQADFFAATTATAPYPHTLSVVGK